MFSSLADPGITGSVHIPDGNVIILRIFKDVNKTRPADFLDLTPEKRSSVKVGLGALVVIAEYHDNFLRYPLLASSVSWSSWRRWVTKFSLMVLKLASSSSARWLLSCSNSFTVFIIILPVF